MVKIEGIRKKYGKQEILAGVSLEAKPGEFVGIIGKNGCGKSTLLSIMAGAEGGFSGEIHYGGENPVKNAKVFYKYTGYVPQGNPLIEELTVKDNLKLWTRKEVPQEVIEETRRQLGLEELLKIPVRKLSGGMRRRVTIASAMMNQVPVLLMDEPTAALDLYFQENIHEMMRTFTKEKGIIICATHDKAEIALCDKVYAMEEGRMVLVPGDMSVDDMVKQYILG